MASLIAVLGQQAYTAQLCHLNLIRNSDRPQGQTAHPAFVQGRRAGVVYRAFHADRARH